MAARVGAGDGPLVAVLRAIEAADGAVDLGALGRRLALEPATLEAMVAFWVRKGRLIDSGDGGACAPERCRACPAAHEAAGCPFLLRAPRTVGPAAPGSAGGGGRRG